MTAFIYTKRALYCGFCFLAFAAAASAAELALKLEINRGQIYLGESFILDVKVSGSSRPTAPDLSQIKNCSIRQLGSRDISNYSITIINGRITKQGFTGRITSYEITPTIAGSLQVGPVSVSVDGHLLTEPGPTVTVTDVEKQDRVIIAVTSSRDTVLVDEPFEITLRILIQRLNGAYANIAPLFPNNPPDLTAPYLSGEGLTGLVTPDIRRILQDLLASDHNQPGLCINGMTIASSPFNFDSFFQNMGRQNQKAKFMLQHRIVEQGGKSYIEYSLALTFNPRDEHNYVFGPVIFKGAVPVKVNDKGQAKGIPVFAVGPACTVRVVPPPEEGRPTSFTGALGTDLSATASLDTTTANVGDPLKLTLTLSGQVRFDKMLPPKLNFQTNIMQQFTVYDNTVQTVKQKDRRQYIYTLRPNHPGSLELPPIAVSYYDTLTRKYKTVHTQPIPLRIKQGTEVTASQLMGHTNHLQKRKQASDIAKEAPAGIQTSVAGATAATLVDSRILAAGVAGPAVYLLVILTGLIRQHSSRWKLAARRRQALSQALRQIHAAKRLARRDPARAGQAIRAAICQYLADRLDMPSAGVTPGDACQQLEQAGIAAATIEALGTVFERYFNAGFSNQSPTHDLPGDCRQLAALLKTIDRETRA